MANLFLAVDPSDEDRHALGSVLADSGASGVIPGRRVPIDNWHVTLRFLGTMTEVQTEMLVARLDETLTIQPGRVWLDGLGAFPKLARATVIYSTVSDPTGTLDALAAECDEAAVDVGLSAEDRPFTAHLTLARVRPPIDVRHVLAGVAPFSVPFDVSTVTLMRTRSVRGGVSYDRVERIEL
jgi:2'-5' RNA ligase